MFTAAVLEYLCAEILELAGNAARDNNRHRIIPRHILLAIACDDELNKVCVCVCVHRVSMVCVCARVRACVYVTCVN